MRRAFFLAVIVFVFACAGSFKAVGQSENKKVVNAFLAAQNGTKATTTFSADVTGIFIYWKSEHLQAGDEIHVVWVAQDVGAASPRDTKINEASCTVHKPDEQGSFSLSRPAGQNWPVGKYRAE